MRTSPHRLPSLLVSLVLAAGAVAFPSAVDAGLAESWYLARGRANMKIANYSAAIEAYRKALELDPRSREASRSLGLALLRNGETDRAVAEFDRHLARFPDDAEIAFEQARILQWSRYGYRSADAGRYLELGLRTRDDPVRRRELARLLGRDRATLDRAVEEYRRLLAASPDDRALRGEYLRLLLWDRSHREEAIRELERRVAEDPSDERSARDLARLLAEDPRRTAEAVERYGALLERHPDDPELRLAHARALARARRRAEAREAYARALALRQPPEARLEYADLLAVDPATRDAARAEYEAVLHGQPRSRRARIGLARVLGARKETSPEAIRAYEAVLRDAPQDAEAHRGLAQAYAWNGDADRALAHGALADQLGPRRPEITELERSLRTGREPAAGAGARAMVQPGGAWALSRLGGFVSGETEPTPFTTSAVEAGFATARGQGGAASGAALDVGAGWRPDPSTRLRAALGWDAARPGGATLAGELGLERPGDERTWSAAVRRYARLDSYRAYAGEVVQGRRAGGASETDAELRAAWPGDTRVELAARAGAVSAAAVSPALVAGATARVDRALVHAGAWTVSAGGAVELVHHSRDLSGGGGPTDPAPRLFSPPLFATASPRILLAREAGLRGRLTLDAGPAVQLTAGPGGAVRAGGDARLAFVERFGDRLRVGGEARFEQLAAVHTRFDAALTAALLFP